jgi:hypothetical protein
MGDKERASMILINYLHGPYDSETSEGRGANAAYNVVRYIEEGKKIAEKKIKQLMRGEITFEEAKKNEPLETLARVYVPYMPVDEETGIPDYKYGLAFASVYLSAFDGDRDGAITPQEAGPLGHIIDFIPPYGKITPGKFLAWFIFQDCTEVYNGVISPKEAGLALMIAGKEPDYTQEQLKALYLGHGINKFEKEFVIPQPAK